MSIGFDSAGNTMQLKIKTLVLAFAASVFCLAARTRADASPTTQPVIYVNHHGLVKLGWQLAASGASFNDRSTFGMIDLLHSFNVHHIELSADQAQRLDASGVTALIDKLKGEKMDVVSYGPVDLGSTETEARSNFEFAKKLDDYISTGW